MEQNDSGLQYLKMD